MTMSNVLTAEKVIAIGEELRTTRNKSDGRMAFDYVYEKHKELFVDHGGFDGFLKMMDICAVFFASRGEETVRDRSNTQYQYV